MKTSDFIERVKKEFNLPTLHQDAAAFVWRYGDPEKSCNAYVEKWAKVMQLNILNDFKLEKKFCEEFCKAEWMYTFNKDFNHVENAFNSCIEKCDDYKTLGELVIVVNLKSWEHASRKNNEWGRMYAEMYYYTKDVFFDKYGKDDDAVAFWYNFID